MGREGRGKLRRDREGIWKGRREDGRERIGRERETGAGRKRVAREGEWQRGR